MENLSIFEIAKQFADNMNNASDAQAESVEKINAILKANLICKKDQKRLWNLLLEWINYNSTKILSKVVALGKELLPSESTQKQLWCAMQSYQDSKKAYKDNIDRATSRGLSVDQLFKVYELGEEINGKIIEKLEKQEINPNLKSNSNMEKLLQVFNVFFRHLSREEQDKIIISIGERFNLMEVTNAT